MKRIINQLLKLRRRSKGSALLELAIGAGVLTMAFTGTFHYGYTFYIYNRLENAVNGGARYAALMAYDSSTTTPSTQFLDRVRKMVVYGDPIPAEGASPVVRGLSTSNVVLEVIFTNAIPTGMRVRITGFTISSVFATVTCNDKPAVTYPYTGLYSPYV